MEEVVTITIIDHSFTLKCASEKVGALQEAAAFLTEQMQKIKNQSPDSNFQKILLLAVLQILVEQKEREEQGLENAFKMELKDISQKITQLLDSSDVR